MNQIEAASDRLRQELIELIGWDAFELYESAFDGCWIWDLSNEGLSWASPKFCETFGFSADEIPQGPKFWRSIAHPDDSKNVDASLERAKADPKGIYLAVMRYRHRDGHWVAVESRGKVADDRAFGLQIDKTDEIEERKKLEALTRLDALTGLLNRRGVEEAIPKAIALSDRLGLQVYAALIDLDDFKEVNSRWGQAAGDLVLRKTAERMRRRLRLTDDCGRVGGDEFIAIVSCRDAREATTIMQRLRDGMSRPIYLNSAGDESTAEVTCSGAIVQLGSGSSSQASTLHGIIGKASPILIKAKNSATKNKFLHSSSIVPPPESLTPLESDFPGNPK